MCAMKEMCISRKGLGNRGLGTVEYYKCGRMNVGSVDAAGWNDSQSAAQTTAEVGENVTR